jgi:hypothetical protein
MSAQIVERRRLQTHRRNEAAVLQLNAEVDHQRNAAARLLNEDALLLNVAMVHRQSGDEVRAKQRARQRRVNSRATIAVWQRHRQNVPRDQRSNGHKPNACRVLCDRRLVSSVQHLLPRGELNVRHRKPNVLRDRLQRDPRLRQNAPRRELNSHGRNRSKGSKLLLSLHPRKVAENLRNHN